MDNLRIYDLIATNPGMETYANRKKLTDESRPLYNPSNLGGGFSMDEAGNLALNAEQISFTMLFRTDDTSAAYQKYEQTVNDMASRRMVWLRYGVPNYDGTYTYAYRPGYVSSLTKTEASYMKAELVETITITTHGGWFKLYSFTQFKASQSLAPSNASNDSTIALFSEYPENYKAVPFGYPYWYQQVIEDIKRRMNGSKSRNSSWYDRWGNVLDSKSDVYTVFAIHAPNMSVSSKEKVVLGTYESDVEAQSNRIKGNSYASKELSNEERAIADSLKTNIASFKKLRKNRRKPTNFRTRLSTYSDDDMDELGFTGGNYDSYLLIGNSLKKGSSISIATSANVFASSLRFRGTGPIIIDTASWANIYSLHGSSIGVDFSKFLKTTANQNDKIFTDGVELSTIIMRRAIVGI